MCVLEDFFAWTKNRKQLGMEFFYRSIRKKHYILVKSAKPVGRQWNYDHDNRETFKSKLHWIKRLPKKLLSIFVYTLILSGLCRNTGKLIINDIKSLLASSLTQAEKIKLYTILDEFSIFASDKIVNLVNQGRSAGVDAVLSTQSLSDILRKGDEALLGQILNNTNNYIIQRQNNPKDAEVLANLIGTESVFEVTAQLSAEQGSTGIGSVK